MKQEKKFNKNIEKIIIFIWKISIVLTAFSLLFMLLADDGYTQLLLFVFSLIFGSIMFSIQFLNGRYIDLKPITIAEKVKIDFNNFQDLVDYISKNINYNKGSIKINDKIQGIVFYEIKRHWYNFFGKEISFIFVVNMKKYDNKTLRLVIKKFEECISDYVGTFATDDYVEFILITCLEESNYEFNNYINKDVVQTNNRIKLPVGIVFNDKLLYIANQKSLLYKSRYKKLRNHVLDIFKITNSKKN